MPHLRIAIIGAGFAGICMGIQLKQAGVEGFTIFEKADAVGGTWRDNVYPGAACDSPSFLYCFSFEQKVDWSRKWASQPEILEYIEHCVEKYALRPHIRLQTEIAEVRFDEGGCTWHLTTGAGEEIEADAVITGLGQLHRPRYPDLEGLDQFEGELFHSARWDPDFDATGRRVGVIGNAASAVQLVPEVAKEADRLWVFQRTANWLIPKNDREYPTWEKRLYQACPVIAKLYRWWIYWSYELKYPVLLEHPLLTWYARRLARKHLEAQVSDAELRKELTPGYPVGGKRILISDDYYPTLQQDHVELVTDGIDRITAEGIRIRGGDELALDTLILATGFRTTEFLVPMQVHGLDGRSLQEVWSAGARAYLGVATPGFPNFFMMYGPNTNLGHNSIIFMLECQARYLVSLLQQMAQRNVKTVDLRSGPMDDFDREMQRRLARTVWAKTQRSWYKTDSGRITNNWAGMTLEYWWRTLSADLDDYRVIDPTATRPAQRIDPAQSGSARA